MYEARPDSAGPSAAVAPVVPSARPGVPVDPRRLLLAVRGARRNIAIGAGVGLLIGGVVAKTLVPREYVATTTVLAASNSGAEDGQRHLRTLADTVKLPLVLSAVRERLALGVSLEKLGRVIEVRASPESNLIVLEVSDTDPEQAARIADATADAFVAARLDAERRRLEERVLSLGTDVEGARRRLRETHLAFDKFRLAHGIADLGAQTHAAIEAAARIHVDAQMSKATAEAEDARARLLKDALKTEPMMTLLAQQDVDATAAKLAELEALLTTEKGRLTADHPRVRTLESEVAALHDRLRKVATGVTTARTLGRNPRWEALQQGLVVSSSEQTAATQKGLLLETISGEAQGEVDRLSGLDSEAQTLMDEVKQAQDYLHEIDIAHARALDEARSPAPDVSLLARAVPPLQPKKATGRLVALLGPIVAAVLVALFTLARALRGFRAHTPSEVAFWGNGPVVASSTHDESTGAAQLAMDIAGLGRKQAGRTLVVGLGARAAAVARRLVDAIEPRAARRSSPPRAARTTARAGLELVLVEDVDLRRRARAADRVLVVVESGASSALDLSALGTRLGRTESVGFVVVALPHSFDKLPDRVGDVDAFLSPTPRPTRAPALAVGD